MENKKLINEIIKINNLMGFNNNDHLTPDKLIISEVITLFKTLLQDSPQAFKVFDDAMSAIKTTGREITEKDINDLVDIGLSKSLSNAEKVELKLALKTHIKTLNNESDFLTYLSKVPTPNKILKKIKNLTIADSDAFLKTALKSVVNSSENLTTKFQTFILSIPSHLNDIRINGWIINSVADYESYIRSFLRNQLSGFEEPARTLMLDKAMLMIKNNDQYKSAIKKLEDSGNISTTVTNYSPQSNIDLLDILSPKSSSTTVVSRKRTSPVLDSNGNPSVIEETLPAEIVTRYENIKGKSADDDVLTGVEQKFVDAVDGWKEFKATIDDVNKANDNIGSNITPPIDISSIADDLFDSTNVLKSNWEDIFFGNFINKKVFGSQGTLREATTNWIRSFFRTTEDFAEDITQTLKRINQLTDEIGDKTAADSIRRGDKLVLVKDAFKELDVLTRRLKNSMLGAQTPENMFETIWIGIEKDIRKSLDEANMTYSRQQEILAKIKGNGDDLTSIENWIKKVNKESSNNPLTNLKERYDTAIKNSQEAVNKIPELTIGLVRVFKLVRIYAYNFIKEFLNNITNYLLFGVSILKEKFLKIAFKNGSISRSGKVANFNLLQKKWRYLLYAYIYVEISKSFISPFLDFFGNGAKAVIEMGAQAIQKGYYNFNDKELKPEDIWKLFNWDDLEGRRLEQQLVLDIAKALSPVYLENGSLKRNFDINPLSNPIAITDWSFLKTIGFENSPVPEFIIKALSGLLGGANKQSTKTDGKVIKIDNVKEDLTEYIEKEMSEDPDYVNKIQKDYTIATETVADDRFGLNSTEVGILKKHMYPKSSVLSNQIWVCGDLPTKEEKLDEEGNPSYTIYKCMSNRKWRMVFYNRDYINIPEEQKKDLIRKPYYGDCFYIDETNPESLKDKIDPGVMDKNGNFENLKQIKGLIKDLI
jgi:hypothetical protein